jgi:hypothetical protein
LQRIAKTATRQEARQLRFQYSPQEWTITGQKRYPFKHQALDS